jgi:hypothetical protein
VAEPIPRVRSPYSPYLKRLSRFLQGHDAAYSRGSWDVRIFSAAEDYLELAPTGAPKGENSAVLEALVASLLHNDLVAMTKVGPRGTAST